MSTAAPASAHRPSAPRGAGKAGGGAVGPRRGALALVALLALARPASAAPAAAAPDELLFTFNAVVYAASSVASPGEYATLRQYLLVYEPNPALDAAYPVRGALAAAVRSWPLGLRQRALRFLLDNPAAATNYNALVMDLFGAAPGFRPSDDAVAGGANEHRVFNHRARLGALLRDAYRQGGVAATWRTLQPAWQRHQLAAAHVQALQAGVVRFLRLPPPAPLGRSTVLSNPLMPLGSGVTSVFADGHFVMLIGPTATPRDQDVLVSHELAHPLLNDLLRSDRGLARAYAASACVFDGIRRDPQAAMLTRAVYTTWESYLSESLVRALSHRIVGVPDSGRGFALTHLLAAEMAHYQAGTQPFGSAIAGLLGQLRGEACGGGSATVLDTAAVDARRELFSRL